MPFTIDPAVHYLNCAYMSPLPASVEAVGREAVSRKAKPWTIGSEDFFSEVTFVKQAFASVLCREATADRVALLPSVSYGMAIVARNLPLKAGQHVVVAGEQFPSNVHPWRRLCRERGAELRTVLAPAAGDGRAAAWNDALDAAIDERTALLAIGHVHWADGTRFDLPRLAARAREVGAWVVVDGTQSVGALDFPFDEVRPDAVVCAGYKWLCCPYGMAFAWLGDRLIDGTPVEETWSGRAGSDDFRGLVQYTDAYGPGAARFDVGQRSNFILLPMAIEALRLVREWGPARIQAHAAALWGPVIDVLRDHGYGIEHESGRGHHLVGVRAPAGADLAAIAARLAERRVFVSLRGDAVRVSPHLYNTSADMAALVDALVSRDA
jgi:selenocysteine lyase/cysteine desulfurase